MKIRCSFLLVYDYWIELPAPFFFLLAATDELLHLQSRQDRADPALRDEPTKLPLVLQVSNSKNSLCPTTYRRSIHFHVRIQLTVA
jgi:hypothetical protein